MEGQRLLLLTEARQIVRGHFFGKREIAGAQIQK
jgi:hypothetical protein